MRVALLMCLVVAAPLAAQPPMPLPAPAMSGGKPLMNALKLRQSSREFDARRLPPQVLSNLLWAAYGVNRQETGGRTAPSAHGWQVVDLYVALPEGLYLFDAKKHALQPVAPVDAREISGTQDFVAGAPLNLVFVARMDKMKASDEDTQQDLLAWAAVEAGAIAQNVYLYCASEGLATVVRAGVQRDAFARTAEIGKSSRILLGQTVGYPK